jgi:hypothetical protein
MPGIGEIVSFSVHPAIGFARVGNSPDAYFLAPEVPGAGPRDADEFRDEQGRIKRQAARFRIFGRNRRGEIVREITAREAEITWTVHLANKKAAWFNFDLAFDIPASEGEIPGTPPLTSVLRNPTIAGADRAQLVIDPGPRTIAGKDVNRDGSDKACAFESGQFFGKEVYLGELRTDEDGRLIVLGGRGHSASKDGQPVLPGQFANNDWWHDDVSDGPVEARVVIDGEEYQADGAWLVVAPPDYAPGIEAIVTGYDLVFEAAATLDPSLLPRRPSFAEHIYPLLSRLVANQWVNAGFLETFGWGSPLDFTRPDLLRRLNDPGEASLPLRHSILRRLRDPGSNHMQADAWPAIYGDAVELDNTKDTDPLAWMPILATQYRWLVQWAEGDFDPVEPVQPVPWEQIPESERADALDRAALDNTVGGPFHPGAEFTWPLRQPILYADPFRIKRRPGPEPDWGRFLTSVVALSRGGPLDGSGPGDLTRWMACPWQTDTSSCLSAYRPYGGEYLPTFWPARVPNDVLTEAQYERIMGGGVTISAKQQAFDATRRERWLRGIVYQNGTGFPAMRIVKPLPTAVFVDQWPNVGILVRRPGPGMPDLFPDEFWVESGRSLDGRRQVTVRSAVPLCEIDPVDLR